MKDVFLVYDKSCFYEIDTPEVKVYLQALVKREILIAEICAGLLFAGAFGCLVAAMNFKNWKEK